MAENNTTRTAVACPQCGAAVVCRANDTVIDALIALADHRTAAGHTA